MGEDTRATDAGSVDQAGFRAGGAVARRADGDSGQARTTGGSELVTLGPYELDEQQLTAWGRAIGRTVAAPAVFALRGDLGAGKSVLARAIATGAGVDGHMPSPTFNLLFQYESPTRVVSHLDLYRLIDPSEVWELGWRDLGTDSQIVLIEWPERAEALLPPERWDVLIEPGDDALTRRVTMVPHGRPPEIPIPSQ